MLPLGPRARLEPRDVVCPCERPPPAAAALVVRLLAQAPHEALEWVRLCLATDRHAATRTKHEASAAQHIHKMHGP